ncbi:group III truncated hemoglobin (plasmid) [Agrobacterium tumefaciens]|nr:group III truncated hemoglobin [Agrobacterium tumefaciens]
MTSGLTEAKINEVLHAFYTKVRTDPVLSVPFSVVQDWEEHMVRLTDFWSSLMLTSGRYKGNPRACRKFS